MKTQTICMVLLTIVIAVSIADNNHKWPESIEKESSIVKVLEIGKLSESIHKKVFTLDMDVDNGLVFTFFIVSKPGEKGSFTLSELRDFEIEGLSYASATKAKLGRLIEPITVILEIDDFTLNYRPDLKGKCHIPAGSKATIMITAIRGITLPDNGILKTSIDVGWGKETEKFPIEANMSIIGIAKTPLK